MNMSEYQRAALTTAKYNREHNKGIYYTALGLCSEAGEVAGKIKKILRDKDENYKNNEHIADISKELGDVLWYVATLANEYGLNLSDIAEENLAKLASRNERGVIGGSGDNR